MKRYYAPTPKWARKLGDALLAASSSITMYAIAQDNDILAYVVLVTGVLGKFLTNLFSEDTAVETTVLHSVQSPTVSPSQPTPTTTQPSTGTGGDRPPVPPVNP